MCPHHDPLPTYHTTGDKFSVRLPRWQTDAKQVTFAPQDGLPSTVQVPFRLIRYSKMKTFIGSIIRHQQTNLEGSGMIGFYTMKDFAEKTGSIFQDDSPVVVSSRSTSDVPHQCDSQDVEDADHYAPKSS